ncbi:MAG: TM2 domain-containing protein [Clostridiales bacterium]|nr:TM2 domain-containing protein [Clostridiales bacterium]
MDKTQINSWMMLNAKYFNTKDLPIIQSRLEQMTEEKMLLLNSVELKDPVMMLVISLFFGGIGVDRFLIGDTGMGVLKLLTAGGCGIIAIMDWFTIMKKTKDKNLETFAKLMI